MTAPAMAFADRGEGLSEYSTALDLGVGYHNRKRWSGEISANLRGTLAPDWMRRQGDRMARCRSWMVTAEGVVERTEACRAPLCPQCRHARGKLWESRLTPVLDRNQQEGLRLDGTGRLWRRLAPEWRDALGVAAAVRDTGFDKLKRLALQDQRGPLLHRWPLFLTLTLRNVEHLYEKDADGRLTWHVLRDAIGRAWRRMRETARRRPDSAAGRLWRHIVGGVKVVEITWNKHAQTWHPHMHVLVLADVSFIDGRQLAELWERYADAYIVDIRAVDGHAKSLRELVKYATKPVMSHAKGDKPGHLGAPHRWRELAAALRGRRLIDTFGCLRDLPKSEVGPAPALEPVTHTLHVWQRGRQTWVAKAAWEGPGPITGAHAAQAASQWRVIWSDLDAATARALSVWPIDLIPEDVWDPPANVPRYRANVRGAPA